MILKHVHRPKPDDDPQNYEYGDYWKRHRDIDNTISSAFMFLPEHFRLPENYGDPTAVHTNLNYHAALICLHLAALEKIEKYQIPVFAKKASETRLFTAAQEIVNIIKMTSHMKTNPVSMPMFSLDHILWPNTKSSGVQWLPYHSTALRWYLYINAKMNQLRKGLII